MLLSDQSILEAIAQSRLLIRPFDPAELQPASVDRHLDGQILAFDPARQLAGDPRQNPGATPHLIPITLVIHSTAGFVDPGWQGNLTLELSNLSRLPIPLYPDMKIGQIPFLELTTPAARPYSHPELGGKYQGQNAPTASRLRQEFPLETP